MAEELQRVPPDRLYGAGQAETQRERFRECIRSFYGEFGERGAPRLFSVPGRSELGGNHTDHEHGRVLACAVDLDLIAAARPNGEGVIRIRSEGYEADVVDLNELDPVMSERNTSAALIRGVAAYLKKAGYRIGGFDAYTTSGVTQGSGLSSSAAFEVMTALLIGGLYNGGALSPLTMALAGQSAEQKYFGKPCGLMDQTACAAGGFVAIDFASPETPVIEKLDFDFEKTGYSLCIVNTAGSHSGLTGDYAAVRSEMRSVAEYFGKEYLRDIEEAKFREHIAEIRQKTGDRAVLRALHFFGDDARAAEEARLLKNGDFEPFLKLITESGRSSMLCLQNGYSVQNPAEQGLMLACALSERILGEKGAFRIHGGGFAGTIQAFVPENLLPRYAEAMEEVFGPGACRALSVRPYGAVEIDSAALLSN